ncbi:uncharacterized protein TNCV_355131 [Trichonephila clavipes]|uniref:Uncharacterized protein n=1 Tax=Trichonephila clavipes TaxID=2585209 RepID=A0A8X6W0U9_TRICX|nr:uncharacterized protein TNCV_355131 [Trichonephila clavipes]
MPLPTIHGHPLYSSRTPWQPRGMSMKSCNHMCCHSCNGSQEPFFNKTMLGISMKGCHKTVSRLLLSFLGLPVPKFVSNRAYPGLCGTASWVSNDFERTRGKVTLNME